MTDDSNVVNLFNDRRVAPSTAPKVQPHPVTRQNHIDHIEQMHGTGVSHRADATTLFLRHRDLHAKDGLTFTHETQHVHGPSGQ